MGFCIENESIKWKLKLQKYPSGFRYNHYSIEGHETELDGEEVLLCFYSLP